MNGGWNEIIVFVHGVSTKGERQSHKPMFLEFCERISASFPEEQASNKTIWSKQNSSNKISAEWGWDDNNLSHTQPDKYLADAEKRVAEKMWKTYNGGIIPKKSFGWLRDFFMHGIADMFYYVSEQGEASIKEAILAQILTALQERSLINPDNPISITCIGHSAGTAILHDLLFTLFAPKYKGIGIRDSSTFKSLAFKNQSSELESSSSSSSSSSSYSPSSSMTPLQTYLKSLRDMADAGQLRLRRFYTLGSPIAPLVFRSNNVITYLALKDIDVFTLEWIGITPNKQLDIHPRWVNFWHSVDIISYPVAYLYKDSAGKIEDVLEKSWKILPNSAHGVYWKSRKVASCIAETY